MNSRWMQMMVVVGCVAFALAILFPAAGLARGGGKLQACMANLHILGRAWLAYPEDNDGKLVGGSNYFYSTNGTPYRWVERPLYQATDNPETNPAPTTTEMTLTYGLNGIRAGELYPYVQDTQAYHCPADRNWLNPKAGYQYQEYRSYSIGGLMNGEDFTTRNGLYGPIMGYRTVVFPTGVSKKLVVAERMTQIRRPQEKFVFVEEDALSHAQLYSVGSFILMQSNNPDSWWDWPAVFHPDRGMLGFSDGHVVGRVWTDARTIDLIQWRNNPTMVQPNNPDLQWMVKGYMACEP